MLSRQQNASSMGFPLNTAHQCTQTESLVITEPNQNLQHEKQTKLNGNNGSTNQHHYNNNNNSHGSQTRLARNDGLQHNLRKSASYSSSSVNSLGSTASTTLGSTTSTMSLGSSPSRTLPSTARALKSDMINTFQKWETTIESVSYVTTTKIAVTDYNAKTLQNGGDQARARSVTRSQSNSRSPTPIAKPNSPQNGIGKPSSPQARPQPSKQQSVS